jgi:hypothetical protein
MGSYDGVDSNITLCPLQGRLQHIYHGQPYARVDLHLMLESTLSSVRDFGICPSIHTVCVQCLQYRIIEVGNTHICIKCIYESLAWVFLADLSHFLSLQYMHV